MYPRRLRRDTIEVGAEPYVIDPDERDHVVDVISHILDGANRICFTLRLAIQSAFGRAGVQVVLGLILIDALPERAAFLLEFAA